MQQYKSASCINFISLQYLELSSVTREKAEVCTIYGIPADCGGP